MENGGGRFVLRPPAMRPQTLTLLRQFIYTLRAFARTSDTMMSWEEEFEAFKARTKGSAKAGASAKKVMPFGVNSNYRLTDPYPLYMGRGKGSRLWDVDGNEYVDFNMASGALARAVRGRRKVLKCEGCYPAPHDTLMVSIKPAKERSGDAKRPNPVPSSKGLVPELVASAVIAPFNDLHATRAIAEDAADDLAAIILEPVPMNMGLVLPRPGFLEGLRRIADDTGAVLIFDEVKTGGKWYGGAEEAFGVRPDLKVFGKAIGGGIGLGAVG